MKQPKVKLFDQTYNVRNIVFNRDGSIDCIWYYRYREEDGVGLIAEGETDEPFTHPTEDYVIVPSFDDILVNKSLQYRLDEVRQIAKENNSAGYIEDHGGSVEYVKKIRRGEL